MPQADAEVFMVVAVLHTSIASADAMAADRHTVDDMLEVPGRQGFVTASNGGLW